MDIHVVRELDESMSRLVESNSWRIAKLDHGKYKLTMNSTPSSKLGALIVADILQHTEYKLDGVEYYYNGEKLVCCFLGVNYLSFIFTLYGEEAITDIASTLKDVVTTAGVGARCVDCSYSIDNTSSGFVVRIRGTMTHQQALILERFFSKSGGYGGGLIDVFDDLYRQKYDDSSWATKYLRNHLRVDIDRVNPKSPSE